MYIEWMWSTCIPFKALKPQKVQVWSSRLSTFVRVLFHFEDV